MNLLEMIESKNARIGVIGLGYVGLPLVIEFCRAGYRVYYAIEGKEVVLLLIGGDKSSQRKDIEKAQEYRLDHKRRKKR